MASARPSVRATVLLSLIAATHAFPSHKRDASFASEGCYVDNANGQRALSVSSYADDGMTVETCAAFCSGSQYFGLEYGRECYCGNVFTSQPADSADCSFPCAGNSTETCGAGNRLNVYINNKYVAPQPAVLAVPYLGCFVDAAARVLPSNPLNAADMTAQVCAENCIGYSYFGLEYGQECWCGDAMPLTPAPASDCSFTCAGNSTQLCGAGWRLNVWSNLTVPPTPPATVGNFGYLGCYPDTEDQRTLTGSVTYDPAMTLEECAAACAAYPYFGVEYGTQCYCGTSLADTIAESVPGRCAMSCGGNPNQICGDGNQLNIYQQAVGSTGGNLPTVDGFFYKSCWTDDVNLRSLTGDEYMADAMTVEACATLCQGYHYFGVEYASQCFCGNELGGEAAPESDCSQLCVGDSQEWCGAGNRLNVYAITGTTALSTTSAASSSSSSWTTSASSAASTTSTSDAASTTSTSDAASTTSISDAASTTTSTSTSDMASTTSTSTSDVVPTTSTSSATTTLTPTTSSYATTLPASTTFPTSASSSPASTLTPATTTSSCPPITTYLAQSSLCWLGLPSKCSTLTNPSYTYPANAGSVSLCSSAFHLGGVNTLPPAISSCFKSTATKGWIGTTALSCLASVSAVCMPTTVPCGTPPPAPTQLIVDGGFESGSLANWPVAPGSDSTGVTISVSTDQAHSGSYSMKVVYSGVGLPEPAYVQWPNLIPAANYQISWWSYSTISAANLGTTLEYFSGPGQGHLTVYNNGFPVGKWVQSTLNFTAQASWAEFLLRPYINTGAAGVFYLDDVSLLMVP